MSREVAQALHDWLPRVLHSIDPFLSHEDIDKGSRWGNELADKLDSIDYGIVCVTPDNLASAWLHFEAGALSKSVEYGKVVPFVVGLKATDVRGPLAQFQAVLPQLEDVKRLVSGINAVSGPQVRDDVLNDSVDTYWPRLDEALRGIVERHAAGSPIKKSRSTDDLVQEVLELVRGLHRSISSTNVPPENSTPRFEFTVGDRVLHKLRGPGEVVNVTKSQDRIRVRIKPDDGEPFWANLNRLRHIDPATTGLDDSGA